MRPFAALLLLGLISVESVGRCGARLTPELSRNPGDSTVTWLRRPYDLPQPPYPLRWCPEADERLPPPEARIVLACRLSTALRPVACRVTADNQPRCRYAVMALRLARTFEAAPLSPDGRLVRAGRRVTIPFVFKESPGN